MLVVAGAIALGLGWIVALIVLGCLVMAGAALLLVRGGGPGG